MSLKSTYRSRTRSVAVAFAWASLMCACGPTTPSDSRDLVSADEGVNANEAGISGALAVGTELRTTADLNFRSGPSTGYKVIRVLAKDTLVELVASQPSNGFYKVEQGGTHGWCSGNYLAVVSGGGSSGGSSGSKIDAAIARAKSGVGFSYWWGHARWLPGGPTSSSRGSCHGSCPGCSHTGSYGADCSGYVAKIWQVPSSNTSLTVDSHPYSTATFVKSSSQWSTVSRSSLKKADALVYNSGGAGHIILYESGNGWGSLWAYECKGCSAGCVRNLRTASSAYKGIRRSGY